MTKYRLICRRCDGIFESHTGAQPLCRQCRIDVLNILELKKATALVADNTGWEAIFGRPRPTPAQEAKWKKARDFQREKERHIL